jgi:hypothetical protein
MLEYMVKPIKCVWSFGRGCRHHSLDFLFQSSALTMLALWSTLLMQNLWMPVHLMLLGINSLLIVAIVWINMCRTPQRWLCYVISKPIQEEAQLGGIHLFKPHVQQWQVDLGCGSGDLFTLFWRNRAVWDRLWVLIYHRRPSFVLQRCENTDLISAVAVHCQGIINQFICFCTPCKWGSVQFLSSTVLKPIWFCRSICCIVDSSQMALP